MKIRLYLKQLYLRPLFYQAWAGVSLFFLISYFVPPLSLLAPLLFAGLMVITISDVILVYSHSKGIEAQRKLPKRLSNGDENEIRILLRSHYKFPMKLEIIDEIPHQFQQRDFSIKSKIGPGQSKSFYYSLRPTQRGRYHFGFINIFTHSSLGLVQRKIEEPEMQEVAVYPSFIQMRKFELYAISNKLQDLGIKRIRRVGHTMEFDQIKEYVQGDDVRSINWKATARANELMVNQFQDERSQNVINVLDMGRVMKMPFDGMHLLDYAINTSLILSNIALIKDDKAGLLAFSNDDTVMVKPEKKRSHIQRIQEALYQLNPNFLESDYEKLVITLRKRVNQRSLVLLYTNFETHASLKRNLPYLQQIAKDHLLVVIFFENTELSALIQEKSENIRQIYTKTVAEEFAFNKRQIVKELDQRGIQTIYTPPKELSVRAINKYLELKARGLI